MASYMNRPPPEYKVPPGGMPGNGYGMPNGMAPNGNPMQNMQKMVNQTSGVPGGSPQNGMYPIPPGAMKTEQTGMAPGQVMNRGSPSMPGQPSTPTEGLPQNMPSYPNQAAQSRQNPQTMMQSQAQTQPNSQGGPHPPPHSQHMPTHSMSMSTQNRPMKPGTPTYTSAILRGQRPPNVNVGPEGLNISQQRPHSAGEWHRQGMVAQGQGPRGSSPLPQTASMAYGYQGQAMGMQGPGGPRMAMAQQQHAMAAQDPQGQQRMAMMQQMHASQQAGPQQGPQGPPGTPQGGPPSMSMSQAMSTAGSPPATSPHTQQQAQSYPQQQGGPPPNGNAEYIPLDFLDNQQTNNSDFFNSTPLDANSTTDIFDELFGK